MDKEELIKALAYDRQQYEKGFLDGYRASTGDGRTAEEMFRELGYERIPSPDFEIAYYRSRDNSLIRADSEQVHRFYYGYTVSMTHGEILACTQLVKEMEEENDKNRNS